MKPALATLLILGLSARIASADTGATPLMIDGKPVPIACVTSFANGDSSRHDPVSLAKCAGQTPDDAGPIKTENGMIGFDDKSDSGYFYYTDLGRLNGLDILHIQSSGGGSGSFSLLVGVERKGDTLQLVQDYANGDRCNGTVSNAAIKDGHLFFDTDGTPMSVIEIGNKNVKLPDNALEYSAQSCVARFHWRDDAFIGASLTEKGLADQPGWTEHFHDQSCFNRFYNAAVARKETELDKDQLSAFVAGFVKSCVASAPK